MSSFVMTIPAVGQIQLAVNGNTYLISPKGSWVEDTDLEELLNKTFLVWCPSEHKFIERKGIVKAVPTANQVLGGL